VATRQTIETGLSPGPNGERHCWYQCTIKGGREGRELDAMSLARACEALGAGEILLNCIDRDGSNSGFDLELIEAVKAAVSIPVIASSGAGNEAHFLRCSPGHMRSPPWLPVFSTAAKFPSAMSKLTCRAGWKSDPKPPLRGLENDF
jgi:hypothetical protein